MNGLHRYPGRVWWLALFLFAGCAYQGQLPNQQAMAGAPSTVAKKPAAQVGEPDYILQNGDIIDVKLYYDPELNDTVVIRPDGKVSLQLVGEIKAAGLKPLALANELSQRYGRILRKPQVAVIVRKFAGQKVFIGGEVASPRQIDLTSEMTALDAIFDAGGFRESADTGSVIIISRGLDGAPVARRIDLSMALSGETPEKDVLLKPFDIIYVPKTFIAKVDQFVDQYIKRVLPGSLNAGFSYTLYRGTQNGTVTTVPLH